MLVSCSGFNKPVRKASVEAYSSQFLYWCEQQGEWPVYESRPKCDKISRGLWDHLPITINAEPELLLETLLAVDSFNDQVNFELFKFEIGNVDPDIIVIEDGAHWFAAAVAKHATFNGKHVGTVKVYNGVELLDREDIIVHELGHMVGLRHDHGNKHSIMFPSATYRVARLERVDIAALRTIYLGE